MKRFLFGIVLVMSFNAYSEVGVAFREAVHERYCSPRAIEGQLEKLKSEEEYRLVAAWVQMRLLHESDKVVDKFALSEQWDGRSRNVQTLVKWLALGDDRETALMVYNECYNEISPENRVVPGLGEEVKPLVKPSELRKKTRGIYA